MGSLGEAKETFPHCVTSSLLSQLSKQTVKAVFPPLPLLSFFSFYLSLCQIQVFWETNCFLPLSPCFSFHLSNIWLVCLLLKSMWSSQSNLKVCPCVCVPFKYANKMRGLLVCVCAHAISFSAWALCTVSVLETESKCSAFNKSHNQQSGSK